MGKGGGEGLEWFGSSFWELDFQAVIESAASAASRKPKSREAGGRRPRGAPLELPSLVLGFLEAVLAADLITA